MKFKKNTSGPFVWIDLEMTGLEVEKDVIIEIAVIVTGDKLNELAEPLSIVVSCDECVLENMNDFCTKLHNKSGLCDLVKKSDVSMAQAEQKVLDYIKQFCEPQASPLCGNSISTDRMFLKKYMPKLEEYFHYRMIDVTTIKELALRCGREEFGKKEVHRALDDIVESIEELKFYKKTFLKCEQCKLG